MRTDLFFDRWKWELVWFCTGGGQTQSDPVRSSRSGLAPPPLPWMQRLSLSFLTRGSAADHTPLHSRRMINDPALHDSVTPQGCLINQWLHLAAVSQRNKRLGQPRTQTHSHSAHFASQLPHLETRCEDRQKGRGAGVQTLWGLLIDGRGSCFHNCCRL